MTNHAGPGATCLGVILALGLVLAPTAVHGKPKKDKTTESTADSTTAATAAVKPQMLGGIDPTNTPVVDDDLLAMSVRTVDQIEAEAAQVTATGRGVLVAVLDGGFNLNHPDLAGRVHPQPWDAVDGDGDPNDPGNRVDDDGDGVTDRGVGHGTFVAGMVLQAAPDATILPVRVRDDEGLGTNAQLKSGLEYAVAMGAEVINLSVDLAQANKSVARLVNRIGASGVVIVVSAGNDGLPDLQRLGWSWYTLPVGAVDAGNRIADFSNFSLDAVARMVFAPGVDLCGPIGAPTDDASGYWSGTSFAAGLVSGAAALVREVRPDLGAEAVRELIGSSVDPVFFPDGSIHPHAGCVSLDRVVANALGVAGG